MGQPCSFQTLFLKVLMNRTQWLRKAKALLRKEVQAHSPLLWRSRVFLKPLPPTILGRTIFDPEVPNYVPILISPRIRSSLLVLAVLLHELVHTAVPYREPSHGRAFRRIAAPLGFQSPFSVVQNITPDLRLMLVSLRNKLGPYPPN